MSDTGYGAVGDIKASSAYGVTFGAMEDGTRYSGIYTDVNTKTADWDFRPSMTKMFQKNYAEYKAHQSDLGGAGSTDKVMVPIFLDPRIIDLSRKWTPLVEMIPRVSNMGLTADFNQITAKGAARWDAEDSPRSETDDTVVRNSKPVKFAYSTGRVTGVAQATFPSFMFAGFQPTGAGSPDGSFADVGAPNARQQRIITATQALKELEETTILNGSIAVDPLEFDGIIIQIAGINDLDKAGADIALNDFHDVVQLAYDDSGRPNLAVCNSRTYSDILKLLSTQITFREATRQVFWGFSAIVFYSIVGEIPLIASQFLTNDVDKGRLIVMDLNVIEMRVLQDVTFEPLAKTNDSNKFMLKLYEVLINRAPQFNAQIINID